MNYEFTKLADVESLTEVPETATVLAEVDGEIKRIPSNGLGGGGAVKTAIIKHVGYDELVASFVSGNSSSPTSTMAVSGPEYYCTNMTFEEAYETMAAGEPLNVILMCTFDEPSVLHGDVSFGGVAMTGSPCIGIFHESSNIQLFWTADGLATELSSGGES